MDNDYFTNNRKLRQELAEIWQLIEQEKAANATLRAALQTHAAEAAKLIEQRDELLAALNEPLGQLSCVLDFWGESGGVGKMVGGMQAYRDAHNFMDQCSAAITKHTTTKEGK